MKTKLLNSLSHKVAAVAVFMSGLIPLNIAAQFNGQFTPDQKLRMTAAIIEQFYVEPVNGDTIAEEAIKAMLKTLDPHSVYSNADETKELTQPLDGKFSGIGIQFNMGTDTVYVIQPTPGGPSEKVGIRPGDRIVMANDTVIAGKKLPNSAVMKILRGPKGSQIRLKVKRGNNPELIEFIVTRDDIPMNSVDAAYMIDSKTGYISLLRFAEETPHEVEEAIRKLSGQGMKKLIIDLQDNGGGYLGAAYQLASMFLPKGSTVVYTSGLHSEPMYFNVEKDGEWLNLPIVVLQNQYSASSSEIFAGAIQDHDRGLVVGRRSFGKGLVQRPFPFPDGSMIRLTVSRYYTPSGRSIQKLYKKGQSEEYMLDMLTRYNNGELWHADSIHVADSLAYKTLNNQRTVYGGGGILPDIFVPVDTTFYSPYYRDLIAKGTLNRFVLSKIDTERDRLTSLYPTERDLLNKYTITPEIDNALFEMAQNDSIKFDSTQWERSKDIVHANIKGLLIRDLYKDGNYTLATNPLNPIYVKAVEVISDDKLYKSLLKGSPDNSIPKEERKNYLLLPKEFRDID